MIELDYDKIQEESNRMQISAFTLVKRKLNYRKSSFKDNCCGSCKNHCTVGFKKQESRLQCQEIGIDIDLTANIESDFICENFSPLYED